MAEHPTFAPAAVAANVDEAMRALVYATLPSADPGLRGPADVHQVLGALSAAAAALEQVVGQLASFLDRELQAGTVGLDREAAGAMGAGDVLGAVADTTAVLADARLVADQLAAALAAAQNHTAGLHSIPAPDGRR
jgi:hypothetical protein